jgi:16S rRNA G966 N2-methylase RsmD
VCWVEKERSAVRVLKENVLRLCVQPGACDPGVAVSETRIFEADAWSFLRGRGLELPFDLIFCDPPYGRRSDADPAGRLLKAAASGWLRRGGQFIVEHGREEQQSLSPGWRLADERRYGRTVLRFFRQTGAACPANAGKEGGDDKERCLCGHL